MGQTALGHVQLGAFSVACINYSVSLFISFTRIERKRLLSLQCPIVPGAESTHLKAGALAPEAHPQVRGQKGGGGQQNQSAHDITVLRCL